MKTSKYLILGMVLLSNVLYAQDNFKNSKVEEMHALKWQYLVDKAQLTPKEVEAVKPVFMEYEQKSWMQHEKNREFFRSVNDKDNANKPSYSEINDRYADVELIQGQNFKSYHLKLRKLLSPEKLYKYYKAEREFKRKLLQDLSNRKQDKDRP